MCTNCTLFVCSNCGIIDITTYGENVMICEICNHEYISSCSVCARRVLAWGTEGAYTLYGIAKRKQDIESSELLKFVNKYYLGKTTNKSRAVATLKRSLRDVGYKGKFIGRISSDNNDNYVKFKNAQKTSGRRWRLRREVCDFCKENEGLILHHIVPTSWGGVTSDENCITVCDDHHKAIHQELGKLLNRMRFLEYIKPHQDEINQLAQKSIDIFCNR